MRPSRIRGRPIHVADGSQKIARRERLVIDKAAVGAKFR